MLKVFVSPVTAELVVLAHNIVGVGLVVFGDVLHVAVVSAISQCSVDCVVYG